MGGWKRFENTETEVLVDYFLDEKNDQQKKDHAFLSLCFRFRSDLLQKCEIICKRFGHDVDVAAQIAENTLSKFRRSKSFKIEKGSQDSIDDCFRLYLYSIAQNELKNYYRQEKKRSDGLLYDGTEGIITELPEIDIDRLSAEGRIIHQTLMALPYSHRVIYLTYTTHERQGVNLPEHLRLKLRQHLNNISQNTVRTYKKEAIDKIAEAKRIVKEINEQL